MANSGAVTLDTVMINIESDAGHAAGNVARLAEHLTALRNSVKGGFGNINKLSEALRNLAPALEQLQSSSGSLQAVTDITKSLSQLKSVEKPTGLIKAVESLEKLPNIINKIDVKTFENLKRVSEELSESLIPVADKMQQIANGYSAFSKIQNTFGKSASTTVKYAKQQRNIFSSLASIVGRAGKSMYTFSRNVGETFGKKAISNIKSFHSKFKQVYLSLLGTRTLFTLIRKGASEYMNFDQTLQKFATNIWRAFGAQLAPAIEYAMELFKQFVRVVYSVIYALTGIDLIARANAKAMQSWGKAAKDTLGNLQKFDDLNVVEFPKGSGDDKDLIEMDKIDLSPIQRVIDWVRKLKEEIKAALDTGEWEIVGRVFADGLSEGVNFVIRQLPKIKEILHDVAVSFGEFLNGAIYNTDWSSIGVLVTEGLTLIPDALRALLGTLDWSSLGGGIGDAIGSFDPAKNVDSFMGVLGDFFEGISSMLLAIPWDIVGKKFGDTLVVVLSNIDRIINRIPWEKLGQATRTAIESVPWEDVWDGIVDIAISSFVKGLNKYLAGLLNIDTDTLEKIEVTLAISAITLGGVKIGKALADLGSALTTIFQSSGLAAGAKSIGDMFASMSGALSGSGIGLGPLIAILVAIMALVEGFRELWLESESFRQSVKDLGSAIGGTFMKAFGPFGKAIKDTIVTFQNFYNRALKPVFDLLVDIAKPIIEAVVEVLGILWKEIVDPFADVLSEVFLIAWESLLGAFDLAAAALEPVIDALNWLWKKLLEPLVKYMLNHAVSAIKTLAELIGNRLRSVVDAFKFVRKGIEDTTNALRGGWKSFVNYMIEKLEWMINVIIRGINGLIRQINKISFSFPDWVPNVGGKKLSLNVKEVSQISLPKLETGTNEIPYEGIYHLHPGEAVVPKKYNPALGNGGSEEMAAKMDALIDIMNNMNFTNVVNIGNKKLYEEQRAFNKIQQNKYGTINLY